MSAAPAGFGNIRRVINMMNRTKKITLTALFTAFAMVLSYVEFLLPPIVAAFPVVKIGLPNIIIIFLLYKFSFKEAACVSFLRLLLSALLFGNAMTLAYSAAGAVLSLTVMVILKKTGIFSAVGVSIAGGISHNLGQIIVAIMILQTREIGYYMIVLTVTGTIAGIFVGLAGMLLLRYSSRFKL